MSNNVNINLIEDLHDYVSEKLGRDASLKDIKKNKLGFYIETPKREYLPDNFQETCLMLIQ